MIAAFAFLYCINYVLSDKFFEANLYDVSATLKAPASDGVFPIDNDDIAKSCGAVSIPAKFETKKCAILTDLIALYNPNGALIKFPKDGTVAPKLYSEKYGLNIGDEINLNFTPLIGEQRRIDVKISALAVEYLGRDVYASFEYLASLGVEPPVQSFYLTLEPNVDAEKLAAELSENPAVKLAVTKGETAKNNLNLAAN